MGGRLPLFHLFSTFLYGVLGSSLSVPYQFLDTFMYIYWYSMITLDNPIGISMYYY